MFIIEILELSLALVYVAFYRFAPFHYARREVAVMIIPSASTPNSFSLRRETFR